ncbi:TIGR03862 family flavoprotein [Hymenobacter sp. BT770]|uniref:NAD(P)/FAD-dependent oxidoreductase n=1 Tax=Hymenobacter sp. BT770 TaxID=2886942 RepID=UPI001D10996C|nr:TIGR03862 family flavoprotein [Hymenobacter sp. BT770]MCC3152250.1 TIGR03862 family flavoprotein [Hymenobacter sp. BT770]MDO3414064.1 TIGR03862 family flavoprotein [Hymenobacter sp. BT770]
MRNEELKAGNNEDSEEQQEELRTVNSSFVIPHSSLSAATFVAIIGGGPAGLMAAQRLAEAGHKVHLFEAQATVGRKFLVAGHGGFNLSNNEELSRFAGRYGVEEARFVALLSHFSPTALRAWAADLGIETFVGTSGRIFPVAAHKPADLLRAWLNRLRELGVEIHFRHRWLGFAGDNGLRLRDESAGLEAAREFIIEPTATVLALGGASWAKTGSDGTWVPLLQELGVPVVPFAPANCGAEVTWSPFFKQKTGRAPLKNIALRVNDGPEVRGEIMLTEYGAEGTPVYALTPQLRAALASGGLAVLHLNLKPDLTPAALMAKLQQRRPGSSLPDFLRKTLHLGPPVPTLLREAQPDVATLGAEAMAELLAAVPLPVAGLRPLDEAISTAGGIEFSALDEHLMLRQRPGTYVAGEMLDWEAPTGGYLLQGCFSTGAWVAQAIVAQLAAQPS